MSALGQKQTSEAHKLMSALPPKAGMCSAIADVRFGPKAARRQPVNELANHRDQRICFGIAAIDGHYARVVRALERNSTPAFARPRGRQAFPRDTGKFARAYLEA